MLESPFPIFCGLNCSYEKVEKEILPNLSPEVCADLVIVYLDNKHLLAKPHMINHTPMPEANNFFDKLETEFGEFFGQKNSTTVMANFTQSRFTSRKVSSSPSGIIRKTQVRHCLGT